MSSFSWGYFVSFVGGMLLLYWAVFIAALWLRARFRAQLERLPARGGPWAYPLALLAGLATPYCSCTTVPIFTGLLGAGVPIGPATTFLVASPTLNPPALMLGVALLGWRVTAVYALLCLLLALAAGLLLGRLAGAMSVDIPAQQPAGFDLRSAHRSFLAWLRPIAAMVVVAAFAGTFLRSWEPSGALLELLDGVALLAVPAATALGALVYADLVVVVPIAADLLGKGFGPGIVLSFVLAASGVGLPGLLLLGRVLPPSVLIRYLAVLLPSIALLGLAVQVLEIQ